MKHLCLLESLQISHPWFRGELAYQTTCLTCGKMSVRGSQFYELDLSLEDCQSLHQCLEAFTRLEMMTGEEQYHCDHCQSKQDATRTCRLTKLPSVLNLQFNRFQYDLQLGRKKKINSAIEFPEVLDMAPYHQVSLDHGMKYAEC